MACRVGNDGCGPSAGCARARYGSVGVHDLNLAVRVTAIGAIPLALSIGDATDSVAATSWASRKVDGGT